MALTITSEREVYLGAMRLTYCRVAFDASYPTGGEAFDPTDDLTDDFNTVLGVFLNNREPVADAGGYVPAWDATNSKILVFEAGADAAALDEVANTTDLSALTCDVLIVGT